MNIKSDGTNGTKKNNKNDTTKQLYNFIITLLKKFFNFILIIIGIGIILFSLASPLVTVWVAFFTFMIGSGFVNEPYKNLMNK